MQGQYLDSLSSTLLSLLLSSPLFAALHYLDVSSPLLFSLAALLPHRAYYVLSLCTHTITITTTAATINSITTTILTTTTTTTTILIATAAATFSRHDATALQRSKGCLEETRLRPSTAKASRA
jgi:hypothetical protein